MPSRAGGGADRAVGAAGRSPGLRRRSGRKCRRSSAMSLAVVYRSDGPLRQGLQADAFQFLGDRVVDLPGRASLDARRSAPAASSASRPGTAAGPSAVRRRRRPG